MTTKVTRNMLNTSIDDNGNATAITIDSSEQVGIGTTSPDFLLDVEGSNTQVKVGTASQDGGFLTSTDNNQLILSGGFYFDGSNFIATSTSASGVSFDNGATFFYGNSSLTDGNSFTLTERMRITSAGHVGIGTTSPNSDLHVKSPDDSTAGYISGGTYAFGIDRGSASGTNTAWYQGTTASNKWVVYDGAGTGRFEVSLSSAGFISDRDQKENITDIAYGLDTVKKLQPKKFKFKDVVEMFETDGEKRTLEGGYNLGFIAQEMVEEVPEIVSGTDGQGNMKIDYAAFTSVLTKAIQEQQDIIDDLKARITTLEGS
mgnify:FL=1